MAAMSFGRDIPEADWKIFRSLHPIALDRFCEKALADIERAGKQPGKSAHELYLAVYRVVQRRDKKLADLFNDLRRSTAREYIMLIRAGGWINDEEFSRFSPETRDWVES